jgi:hypothetical protein
MSYLDVVKKHYPKAVYLDLLGLRLGETLERMGYKSNQVMLANSICADDINSMQIPSRIKQFLGPFNMGGLDGFPFTGQTGMGAFASHVTDDGALLIFFAPHIGISAKGDIGKILRPGQSALSNSCGAARAALDTILGTETEPVPAGDIDHQQDTIVAILWKEKQRILDSEKDHMIEATQIIYEHIASRLKVLLEGYSKHRNIFVIGGVFINVDRDENAFFSFAENVNLKNMLPTNEQTKFVNNLRSSL